MATEVLLPKNGNTVESCIILEWKKQEGDEVAEGEIICEVETDKATFEVESTAAGVLRKQLVSEGDDVPVLSPIAVVGGAEEEISELVGENAGSSESEEVEESSEAEASPGATEIAPEGKPEASPKSPGAGAAPGPAATTAPGPGSEPPRGESSAGGPLSPRARLRAKELGVDPEAVTGSGPGGRVIERDIVAAAEERGPVTSTAQEILAQTAAGGRMSAEQAAAASLLERLPDD